MRGRTTPALSPKLDGVHREFENWRRTRKPRSSIPEPLWALAVERAREAGVHATARRLRLNYYSLKERVESAGRPGATGPPAFVELVPTVLRRVLSASLCDSWRRCLGDSIRAAGRERAMP
jgi:hypothetical protein